MDAYRDPLGALRSQIMTKRMVIADVERGLLPLAISLLSDEEGAELAALRDATSDGDMAGATVESLCEIERRLDAMHALLTGVAERWKLPDEPSVMEAPPQPWAEGPPGMREVRALLESSFGEGTAERFGSEAFRVRFFDEGALFVLVADVFMTERHVVTAIGHLALTLRASMPESLPELALGPEPDVGAYQNLIRSPHWLHGDIHKKAKRQLPPERAFWTSGDAAAAAALVDDEVHDALVVLLSTCVLEAPSARARGMNTRRGRSQGRPFRSRRRRLASREPTATSRGASRGSSARHSSCRPGLRRLPARPPAPRWRRDT